MPHGPGGDYYAFHYRPDSVYRTSVLQPFDPRYSPEQQAHWALDEYLAILNNQAPFMAAPVPEVPTLASEIARAAQAVADKVAVGKTAVVEPPGEPTAIIGPDTPPPPTPIAQAIYSAAAVITKGNLAAVKVGRAVAVATPKGTAVNLGGYGPAVARRWA